MPELAYVNGEFSAIADAKVSVEDRGFQFGDGIYEVIVYYGGKPFLLDRHMARLKKSAAAIGLDYDFGSKRLEGVIAEGVRRADLSDAMVYVQLTRGAAPRTHTIPRKTTPTVVMTFKPLPVVSNETRERGLKVMTVPDKRWTDCHIKAITLLPNVLAKSQAIERGFDDAVFVAADGRVRECTSSNIFVVKNGTLILPPRDHSILHGVTQGFLMECAQGIGLPVKEDAVSFNALLAADEVFLCSTLTEVLGIVQVDAQKIGNGSVGGITRQLFQEFRRLSRASCT